MVGEGGRGGLWMVLYGVVGLKMDLGFKVWGLCQYSVIPRWVFFVGEAVCHSGWTTKGHHESILLKLLSCHSVSKCITPGHESISNH